MGVGSNIVIAGVGGQGTLIASRIIGGAAIKSGCDVKVSEVHGMSQRGGSVTTFVKFSENKVASPIVDPGCADAVLAFELLEAYRAVPFLKKGGTVIANSQKIIPMPVITGAAVYPEDIENKIKNLGIKIEALDANSLAVKAGSKLAVNVVLIGKLAAVLSFAKEIWTETIRETVKPAFLEINLKAFEEGYAWGFDG